MNGLYITRIRLTNVKAFKELDIDIAENPTSLLFSGDNGNGKSTLLRSIALGLSDEMGAYGLLSELSGSFVNYGAQEAKIEIFLSSRDEVEYKIQTTIKLVDKYGTQKLTQNYQVKGDNGRFKNVRSDDFPLYDLFCTAYGTSCRTFGKERYHQYYHTDSVYQLFKNDATLTEQELGLRRLLDYRLDYAKGVSAKRKKRMSKIVSMLSDMLNLQIGWEIILEDRGIFFIDNNNMGRNDKPEKTELSAMGDGVRAITTVLLDIMSWWNLYLDEIPDDEDGYHHLDKGDLSTLFKSYHGIIIIDEIEIHLHPTWRKTIISDLISNFPNVQFIFTTHSAMCVSGATDIAEQDELRFFRLMPTGAKELNLLPGSTANEILRTEAFGLNSTTGKIYDEKMHSLETEILENISNKISGRQVDRDIIKEIREKNPNQRNFESMMSDHLDFIKKLDGET